MPSSSVRDMVSRIRRRLAQHAPTSREAAPAGSHRETPRYPHPLQRFEPVLHPERAGHAVGDPQERDHRPMLVRCMGVLHDLDLG